MKKIIIAFLFIIVGCSNVEYNIPDTIQLLQLPSQDDRQSMSYIITNQEREVFVIDGGSSINLDYLIGRIREINPSGEVTGWFITHYHDDHSGALAEYLLSKRKELSIKNIYLNLPNEDWVEKNEPSRFSNLKTLNEALTNQMNVKIVNAGGRLQFNQISIDILRTFNLEITNNAGNNSSTVYKFTTDTNTILFLADLGIEGGEELVSLQTESIKDMDYVQMAHHGQDGVGENVYQLINPKYCLWPTPQWLWNNSEDAYKTDETKQWIEKLNVKKNYIAKDGLIKIDIH